MATVTSPVNTTIATKLRMVLPKKIRTNAKQSGPGFPSELPGAGNFDETTWYGVLVTIIMRHILHRHRQEKQVVLQLSQRPVRKSIPVFQ